MITIPTIVEEIIKSSPNLEELLEEGIVNYSALARKLIPVIEDRTLKQVQEGAVVMALKRLSVRRKPGKSAIKKAFKETPDMIVRSNLVDFTVRSTDFTVEQHKKILQLMARRPSAFLTISKGVFETTIITTKELKDETQSLFKRRAILAHYEDLSSVTIRLTVETTNVPGVYYMILKSLAWEGINLIEIVSTFTELTLVLKNADVDRAFSIIKSTF